MRCVSRCMSTIHRVSIFPHDLTRLTYNAITGPRDQSHPQCRRLRQQRGSHQRQPQPVQVRYMCVLYVCCCCQLVLIRGYFNISRLPSYFLCNHHTTLNTTTLHYPHCTTGPWVTSSTSSSHTSPERTRYVTVCCVCSVHVMFGVPAFTFILDFTASLYTNITPCRSFTY